MISNPPAVTPEASHLNHPEYWRLRAELQTLRDLLGLLYVRSVTQCPAISVTLAEKFADDFQKLAALHHEKLLTEIEDRNPALAARLDDRDASELA